MIRTHRLTGLHWFASSNTSAVTAWWTGSVPHGAIGFTVLPDEQRYGILPKGRISKPVS